MPPVSDLLFAAALIHGAAALALRDPYTLGLGGILAVLALSRRPVTVVSPIHLELRQVAAPPDPADDWKRGG